MSPFMILFFLICALSGWIGCRYANRDISLHTFPERKISNLLAKLFATCVAFVAACQQSAKVPLLWLVPAGVLFFVLAVWLIAYFRKKKRALNAAEGQPDDSQMQLNEAMLRTVSCVALAEMVGLYFCLVISTINAEDKIFAITDAEQNLCLAILLACGMLHVLALVAYLIHIQRTAKEARSSAGVVLLDFRKKTRTSPKI